MGEQEIQEAAKKVILSQLRDIRDISPVLVQEILDQDLDGDTMDHILEVVKVIIDELDFETQAMSLESHA